MPLIGSTSYVYTASLVENARRLAGQVDDMELVLFDGPHGSNIPADAEIGALRQIAADTGLSYTVHLPADLPCRAEPEPGLWPLIEQVMQVTRPLDPRAWVFHLETPGPHTPAWDEHARRSLERLCALAGDAERLALENLESYPVEMLRDPAAGLGIHHALDVGHLWKAGRDPLPVLRDWLGTATVVHLHGCERADGAARDHLSLACMPPAVLDPVVAKLQAFAGVLTLEVFETDYFTSRAAYDASVQRVAHALNPTN